MPRPLSDSWQYFQVLTPVNDGRSKKTKCTFCGHEQTASITRLHQHLLNRCSRIPGEIRQELRRKDENNREPPVPTRHSFNYEFNPPLHTLQSPPGNDAIPQHTSISTSTYYQAEQIPPRSTPIPTHFQPTSQPQSDRSQTMLDWQLARALFSANIPFEAIENLHLIEFFGHLQPGYKLPQVKRLKQLLLKEEHWDIIQQCENQPISNTYPSSSTTQQPQQHHLVTLSSDSSRAVSSFNPPTDLEGNL
jgi:hypothetical protein